MNIQKITSTSNTNVQHAHALQRNKKYRIASHSILIEGKNLLVDLVKKVSPLKLFIQEPFLPLFQESTSDIFIIDKKVTQKISLLDSPEGCFAEFLLPKSDFPQTITKGLVLDRLQDPGNMGTILRTALALGIETVFFIEPCCDIWNPKVIRAAKGAHFNLSLLISSWEEIISRFPDTTLYVADPQGEDIQTIKPLKSWLLVLGNEAHGVQIPSHIPQKHISIPMSSKVESLNVAQAGAIALYALTRL